MVEETIAYSSADNSATNETGGRPEIQPGNKAQINPADGSSEMRSSSDGTEYGTFINPYFSDGDSCALSSGAAHFAGH